MHGSSMASPAFQRLLYTALRALIDELGVATFNAGGWAAGNLAETRMMPCEWAAPGIACLTLLMACTRML